jgi:predicted phage terminase large subunit-like protein
MTIQTVISLHRMLKYLEFGIEDNLFQRLLLKEFDTAARVAAITLPLRGVTSHLAKETRIASLSALVERGQIRFRENHTDQGLLIEQMIYFPAKNFHDDGPDALEGAIRMAQKLVFEVANVEIVPTKDVYHEFEHRAYRPQMGFRPQREYVQ